MKISILAYCAFQTCCRLKTHPNDESSTQGHKLLHYLTNAQDATYFVLRKTTPPCSQLVHPSPSQNRSIDTYARRF